MREADRIAKKVLTKEIAEKVTKLSDEKAEKLLPKLRGLEDFFEIALKEK